MQARRARWSEIEPLTYLRHPKTGEVWRVDQKVRGWLLLSDRSGRVVKLRPQDPNKEIIIMDMTLEEATTLVQRELGGTVIEL